MGGVGQGANVGRASGAQQGHHGADALDLGHVVSCSRPDPGIRQPLKCLVEVGEGDLAQ